METKTKTVNLFDWILMKVSFSLGTKPSIVPATPDEKVT